MREINQKFNSNDDVAHSIVYDFNSLMLAEMCQKTDAHPNGSNDENTNNETTNEIYGIFKHVIKWIKLFNPCIFVHSIDRIQFSL